MKRRNIPRLVGRLVVVLGLAFILQTGQANGDILISLAGTGTSGSNTLFTYNVFLNPGFELDKTGSIGNGANFFTLYDVPGLVGTPSISAALSTNGFTTVNVQNTGKTPASTAPPDSGSVANVTFNYTKSTEISNPATGMNLFLGQFTLTSTFAPSSTANLTYAAATQKNLPGLAEDEHLANNVSLVVGPAATVPEPATLVLVGLSIPLAGGFLLRRRRYGQSA
jgi:hypothetical protein